MVGRQLPFFSLLIPFWLVWAFCGLPEDDGGLARARRWPASPSPSRSSSSRTSTDRGWSTSAPRSSRWPRSGLLLLVVAAPRTVCETEGTADAGAGRPRRLERHSTARSSCGPGCRGSILSVLVFVWGIPQVKALLDGISVVRVPVPVLDQLIERRAAGRAPKRTPEAAVFTLNWLSATGTGIFVAAIVSRASSMGFSLRELAADLRPDAQRVPLLAPDDRGDAGARLRHPLLRDSTRRWAWPSPGPASSTPSSARCWAGSGVALTGSDTSSNVLFGSLQKITGGAARPEPGAHGRRQQLRRRDGQDDRRPEHRRRLRRPRGGTATKATSSATSSRTAWCWPRSWASSSCLQAYVFPFTKLVVK